MRSFAGPAWAGLVLTLTLGGAVGMGFRAEPGAERATPADARVQFGRDIRPILADRCFKCHGPDEAAREATGGLRLDSFEGATVDLGEGRHPLVPGDAEASVIVERLRHPDPDMRMPPPESKLTVSEDEIRLIERWIAQGGQYEGHWAFQAPVRPPLPRVQDGEWVRNPIDAFILARLEQEGIKPSPEADRETLIRRVSLDLTGLPPTPEEIDDFLADDAPGAYERVVDRLLVSPAYGERMAMYWLDVARYADTHGYHHDNYRDQWPWRDWVIHAFNDNKPFDRFITEQLAGDLLADATLDTRVATGFCRNHPITDEGGAIEEEYLTEYAADRVETMSTALLGLTMQCCRCHDHKYDPVTQDDYYGLFAFFNSVNEKGVPDYIQGKVDNAFPPFVAAPTDEQSATLAALKEAIDQAQAAIDDPIPGLAEQQASWEASLRERHAVHWKEADVKSVASENGATLTVLDDGSILASGENPAKDVHTIVLHTQAPSLRLLRLDVLPDSSLPMDGPGRSENGNAVLSGVDLECVSLADPSKRERVAFSYAWADHEQPNGDFDAQNTLDPTTPEGWAIDAHRLEGARTLLLMADEPFGFTDGSELRLRLHYESIYAQHTLGRVRARVGSSDDVREGFPTVWRDWFLAGPFTVESAEKAFATRFGPEGVRTIDLDDVFGPDALRWNHRGDFMDGQVNSLAGEQSAFYLGRSVFSPVARTYDLSIGSDDTIQVYLDGEELLSNESRRPAAPDQEKLTITLAPGESALVLKVVNAAGPAGFYFKATPADSEPTTLEPLALIDRADRTEDANAALDDAFRIEVSPEYARRRQHLADVTAKQAALVDKVPNVMIMEELAEPRPTYVLTRGVYDNPDMSRPVERHAPRVLGTLPEDAPRNRLGLAEWLVSDGHPLTSRVAVNRLWQIIYGVGIVRTSEDFGIQGEWPSHPDLLDWLAVEFREGGWDVKAMMRLIVTSATYRQASAYRPDLREIDPANRLHARGTRVRMSAEMIRDNALAASGLLVRTIGGPSVKPYQPDGLWRERAMLDSDTRIFERDTGSDLYRRGLYTFWKRSAPPPQMATFDAPEREYCVVRRGATSTPLQALVLLNDETYLEIARALAQRAMIETPWTEDPTNSIVRAFRLATGRRPAPDEVAILRRIYEDALARYQSAPTDAEELLSYGEASRPDTLDTNELAAMTIVAGVILNLDETITKD